MFIRSEERSYRGQTKHLFSKNRSTEVCENKKEKTDQGHTGRKKIGPDEKSRSRFIEIEGSPNQKGQTERSELQSEVERPSSGQIKNSQKII